VGAARNTCAATAREAPFADIEEPFHEKVDVGRGVVVPGFRLPAALFLRAEVGGFEFVPSLREQARQVLLVFRYPCLETSPDRVAMLFPADRFVMEEVPEFEAGDRRDSKKADRRDGCFGPELAV
jgi:hypothetical protein